MDDSPPPELVDLLPRLGLANVEQIRRVQRRARRLARELPLFASVWVDALAQARVLTAYQAAEINAGRGEALAVGPYVILRPLPSPGYGRCFAAREKQSLREARIVVIDHSQRPPPETHKLLEALVVDGLAIRTTGVLPVEQCGESGGRVWAQAAAFGGRAAADWMLEYGRLPAEAVLEIAHQMAHQLASLESAGLVHGDLSATGTFLTQRGQVLLPLPGLRGVVRPEEGYAHADLPPACYDTLAPERISDGTPSTVAGDLYACGCLWWHLLTGRPPRAGGNAMTKIRAAQSGRVDDVGRYAADVPAALAEAISNCTQRSVDLRPQSFAQLATLLGPPTRAGRAALAQCLAQRSGTRNRTRTNTLGNSRGSAGARAAMVAAATAVALAVFTWPVWRPAVGFHAESHLPPVAGGAEAAAAASPSPPDPRLPDRPPARDGAVRLAVYHSEPGAGASPDGRPVKILPSGLPVRLDRLDVAPRTIVRAADGRRATVEVPHDGLRVDVEGVRFEKVDFLWKNSDHDPKQETGPGALIDMRADGAEFIGCSWRSTGVSLTPPVAIRWQSGAGQNPDEALVTGSLRLRDVVFDNVAAAVSCRFAGAINVQARNVLHLGSGALVRLEHRPRADQPVSLSLEQVTLRSGQGVLSCLDAAGDDPPGRIAITAQRCVFAPSRGAALMLIAGSRPPAEWLQAIEWNGQGALLVPECPFAAWRNPVGELVALDDSAVSINGLVHSRVEFAGPAAGGPAASQATRWQVPLRSPDPPGIQPERLHLPAVEAE